MRVAVCHLFFTQKLSVVRERLNDDDIGVAIRALRLHGHVGCVAKRRKPLDNHRHESTVHANVHNRIHALLLAELHVVLAKTRRDVDDARAAPIGDKIRGNHAKRVFVIRKIRKQRFVLRTYQFLPHERVDNGKRAVLHDRGKQRFADDIAFAFAFDEYVFHIRLHGEENVPRQRPRRRRPNNGLSTGKLPACERRGDVHGNIGNVEVPLRNLKIR